MIDVADGNSIYYYHFDGLGSVTALSDNVGAIVERYSYTVFGEPTIRDAGDQIRATSDFGNCRMFTGCEYDSETDNYYYRARFYKPSIGRFLQTDPVGYSVGINLYTYCSNNPLNFVDPMGLYNYNAEQTRAHMDNAKTNLQPFSSTIPYYREGYDYKSTFHEQQFEVPFFWGNQTRTDTEYGNTIAGYKNTYQRGLEGAASTYTGGLVYAAIETNGKFWVEWQDGSARNITQGVLQGLYERYTESPWVRAVNVLEGLWNYPHDTMAVLEAWADTASQALFNRPLLPPPDQRDIPYGTKGSKKK